MLLTGISCLGKNIKQILCHTYVQGSYNKNRLITIQSNKLLFGQNNESGQALLIILLIMSVILAVVLSVSTKSVSDVGVTTQQKESLRAFSAAEAGVEQLLLPSSPSSTGNVSYDTNTQYSASKNETDVSSNAYVYPRSLSSGETATFWFVSHNATGKLSCSGLTCTTPSRINVCWLKQNTPPAQGGAIEIIVFYDINAYSGSTSYYVLNGDSSGVNVKRLFYDPNSTRALANGFSTPTTGASVCTIGTDNFAARVSNINLSTGLGIPNSCLGTKGCVLMVKVKMFYQPTPQPVGLTASTTGGTILPPQAITISSTGVSGNSTRKVDVAQSYPDVPGVFDTTLFGAGDITK